MINDKQNLEKEMEDIMKRLEKFAHEHEEYEKVFEQLEQKFKNTPEGKEFEELEKFVNVLKNKIATTEKAREIFGTLINYLKANNDKFNRKIEKDWEIIKVEIEESEFIVGVVEGLEKAMTHGIEINKFRSEIAGYIGYLRNKKDKKTIKKLLDNKYVKKAAYFNKELEKLKDVKQMLVHLVTNKYSGKDLKNFTKLQQHPENLANWFLKNIEDEEIAREILKFSNEKKKHTFEQWFIFIKKLILDFEGRRNKILTRREDEARTEVARILSERNEELEKTRETLRLKVIKDIEKRREDIVRSKEKTLNKFRKWKEKRVHHLRELQVLGEVEAKEIPEKAKEVTQATINKVDNNYKNLEFLEKLDFKSFMANFDENIQRLEGTIEVKKSLKDDENKIKKILKELNIIKNSEEQLLQEVETNMEEVPREIKKLLKKST